MIDFFKKQREFIAIIAYAGVILAVIYFAIMPLISGISNINDEIQKEKMNQEIKKKQLEDFPKVSQQYEMVKKDESNVDVLFDRNNAVVLIERLEKLAEESNNAITIAIVETAAPAKTKASASSKAKTVVSLTDSLPSPDYIQMKISLVGTYNGIINFINLLENLEYYSDIIDIKIGQADPNDNQLVSVGMFGNSGLNSGDKTKMPEINGDLAASIDAAFYTKK